MAHAYRGPFIVFVSGLLGFFMAIIENMAYTNNQILNVYLSSASMLQGLQILTIVVALLVGCVIAAATQ